MRRNKLFNNINLDSKTTKFIYDKMFQSKNKNGLNGFIQEISLDPFGLLFTSEIQVWDKLINFFKKDFS